MTEARYFLQVTCEGVDGVLPVTSLTVHEAISELRTISVELPQIGVVPQDILKKGMQVDVILDGKSVRRFEGVVMKAAERWRGAAGMTLRIEIGSPLALLELTTDYRIFQNKTMPEVVKAILTDAGIPADRIDARFDASYQPPPSITQYGESMYAFISRLLEAEGACFWVEDDQDGLKVVLGDAPDAHQAGTPATLPYVADAGTNRTDIVTAIDERVALRATKVTLSDLDWTKPALDLTKSATVPSFGTREVYAYPGGYTTAADGARRAKVRAESIASNAGGIRGTAIAPGIAAGKTFTLESAARSDLDAEWIVTSADHVWSAKDGQYKCTFAAVPKASGYRPPLRTPVPRVRGVQTAIVTGPSGQEIYTDAHNRVKLKFPWDRRAQFDENASAWARVGQLAMAGSVVVPRIGWEVLVQFEHGDPDRPVVLGRLYNATYKPPYALPGNKTRSTFMSYSSPDGEGHNEIRIEDSAGAEHIHMHAQKDMILQVMNDRTTKVTTSRMVTVKADEEVTVKGNRTSEVDGMWQVTVAGGQTLAVEGARTKTVKKDEKVTVIGDRKLSITGSHEVTTENAATFSVEGDVTQTFASTLSESADEGVSVAIGDDCSLTVGGAKSEQAKKGKTDQADGKRSVTVGGAVVANSGADMALMVGGKRTSNIGAAWSVTSQGDVAISSADAIEITVGGAMSITAAQGIAFKVGSSKVYIGQGGVVIESGDVKVSADGPAAVAAGMTSSG